MTDTEYVKCNLCDCDDADSFFKENGWQVVKCRHCGLVYVNPRPLEKDFHQVDTDDEYSSYLENYISGKQKHLIKAENVLREMEIIKPGKGRLLEVGCSAGFFIKAARDRGWEVVGVEPNIMNADYGIREYGLEIIQKPVEGLPFSGQTFDAVVCFNLLSHLEDPKLFLKQ